MIGFSFAVTDIGGNSKFGYMYMFFFCSFQHTVFHFFAYHVFAKCRYEMLSAPGYYQTVGISGNKFYRIAQVISPKPRIAVNDQRIIFSNLYITKGNPCWIVLKNFPSRDK